MVSFDAARRSQDFNCMPSRLTTTDGRSAPEKNEEASREVWSVVKQPNISALLPPRSIRSANILTIPAACRLPMAASTTYSLFALCINKQFVVSCGGLRIFVGLGIAEIGHCVLFYDKGGNLLDDYIYYYNKEQAQKPVDLPDSHFFYGVDRFKDVPRDPSDASNGKLAQDKSMSGRFDVIKIPYGQYYIVGVANLEKNSDNSSGV